MTATLPNIQDSCSSGSLRDDRKMCVVVPHILARGTRWRVLRCIPSGRPALSQTHHSALLNTGVFRWQSFRAGQRRMTTYRRCTTRKGEFLLPLQSQDRGELSRSPGPHRPTLRGLDAVRGSSLPLNLRAGLGDFPLHLHRAMDCQPPPINGKRGRRTQRADAAQISHIN